MAANSISLHDGINANYFTSMDDANGFREAWSGDYLGVVHKHDTGTNDNSASINWYATTPNMSLGDAYGKKRLRFIKVSGDVQSSGTLAIDVYLDKATTADYTVTLDMSDSEFDRGLRVPLRGVAEYVKLKFRNSELDVPVTIDGFKLYYQHLGSRV